MTNWYDSDNPTTVVRGATWRTMIWVAVVVVFCILLGAGVWAVKTAASPTKGRGDAYRQQQSATNRVNAQQRFEELYQEVLASDAKLAQAKAALDANPESTIKQTELTGLTNHCIDTVADYNAEARKYLSKDFRSFDLPAQISNVDAATDCKP